MQISKSKLILKLRMQKWKPWGQLTNWLANASLLHSHVNKMDVNRSGQFRYEKNIHDALFSDQ